MATYLLRCPYRRRMTWLHVPHRLHGGEGIGDQRVPAARSEAGEAEVGSEGNLVGGDGVAVAGADDALDHARARQAEANAGLDEIDHLLFMVGEAHALRHRPEAAEDV